MTTDLQTRAPLLTFPATIADARLDGTAGAEQAGQVRAAQVRAVMRFTPMAAVVNLINAGLVAYVAYPVAGMALLVPWLAALTLVMAAGLRSWHAGRRSPRRSVSPRALRRAALHGGILAGLWALVPILWFPASGAPAQLVIACVTTGMICAGGFALSTIAQAATAYVLVLTAGTVAGLAVSAEPFAPVLILLLLLYAAVVVRSATGTARLFTRQFLAEAALRERGQVIELLLAEFEENASDWLFELDEGGVIRHHSPRFGQVAEEVGPLHGRRLSGMLAADSAARLETALRRGIPFRDLVVEAMPGPARRWWSLTAGAITDDAGRRMGWRGVGSDITEAKVANDRIAVLAMTDTLTGLPNRAAFRESALRLLGQPPRSGGLVAVGCLDLDQFKAVNDTLGHPAGDRLLCLVADKLTRFVDGAVQVSRLGGDEFGVLFHGGLGRDEVVRRTGDLIRLLSATYNLEGERVTIGASVGLAFIQAGGDVDAMMRSADLALYRAKDAGGGRAVVYDAAMHREAENRRRVQEDLALALERNELVLQYQPILDIAARRVVGFEALLRWRHPEHGLLGPGAFMAIAEASGLIVPIGDWVLAAACAEAAGWPDDLYVSVNVSPAQIGRSPLARSVRSALDLSGLDPTRLELEITESLFLRREAETAAFLDELHRLGVSVALDDFGTGYSSLGYLGRFRIDRLKIDRSFVSGPAPLPQRMAIVQAIVGMARNLGLKVTAEGVEDEAALEWLHGQGCRFAQGFLFSVPVNARDIPALLESFDAGEAAMLVDA